MTHFIYDVDFELSVRLESRDDRELVGLGSGAQQMSGWDGGTRRGRHSPWGGYILKSHPGSS